MGRVLIWQCIRFIPACPVSIPTLFIAAQSAGVKKPPGDEGAVLALALADPPSLVTHSHSQKSTILVASVGLLVRNTWEKRESYAAFVWMVMLCLQRAMPGVVRVATFCGDYFASNGCAPQKAPQSLKTKYFRHQSIRAGYTSLLIEKKLIFAFHRSILPSFYTCVLAWLMQIMVHRIGDRNCQISFSLIESTDVNGDDYDGKWCKDC